MIPEKTPCIVDVEVKDKVLILRIKGRLDALCAAEIDHCITHWIENGVNLLLLNFASVPYLSSAGLRLLLLTTIKLKSYKGKMVICSLSDEVRYVLRLTGFDSVFDLQENESNGMISLSQPVNPSVVKEH